MNDLLIWAVAFLAFGQFGKALIDLWSTKMMIKAFKHRDEIHEEEWKRVILYQEIIIDKLNSMEKEISSLDMNLHALQDDVFDVLIRNTEVKKTRGPYKPRKPKEIGHKKTPLDN